MAKENMVAGVALSKARPEIILDWMGKLNSKGAKLPTNGSLVENIERLVKYLDKVTPEEHAAGCHTCGGVSDTRMPCCPFCGDGEMIDPQGNLVTETPTNGSGSVASEAKLDLALTKANKSKAKGPRNEQQAIVSDTKLDHAVAKVHDVLRQSCVCYWSLGQAILEIYESKLHLERRDEKGKPLYTNWEQFCKAELKISRPHTYAMMNVAIHFTKSDAEKFSPRQLQQTLRLGPEEREILKKRMAKGDLSKSKMAEELRELAAEKGQKTKDKTPTTKPKVPKGSVTVALVLGRGKIDLFARPKAKGADPKRATRLTDDASGIWALLNGVEVFFKLAQDAKGRLFLSYETRRKA